MTYKAQTFRARSMPEALARVKRALGPDAIILGTHSRPAGRLGRLVGRDAVEIIAAPPDQPARTVPVPPARAPALPEDVYPYFVRLVQNEVSAELATRLLQSAANTLPKGAAGHSDALGAALRRCIARLAPSASTPPATPGQTCRLALVGPPGGGKTTTLAKLAAHLKLRQQRRVGLLSLDAQRPAAPEQLRRYAEVIQIPIECAQTAAQVPPAIQRLQGVQYLLIDTPGVGQREPQRWRRLTELLQAAQPHEVHLVLPASTAAAVQLRSAETFAPLHVSRLVLTRLDEAVGFGAILDVLDKLKCELSYLTSGQNVPHDLEPACSQRVAELILPPKA